MMEINLRLDSESKVKGRIGEEVRENFRPRDFTRKGHVRDFPPCFSQL